MGMKPSIKVGLFSAAVAAAIWGGMYGYGEMQLQNFNPKPIKPGKVTLVAVNTDLGFAIRVANSVAHLVQVEKSGGFEAPQKEGSDEDARRIPMKELLESLQGNEESLVRLVAVLNKINLDDIQPGITAWTAEDIQKALDGDPALEAQLVKDLNVRLDGSPLDEIRVESILNGIQVIVPIPVEVNIEGEMRTLVAQMPLIYQPRLAKEVANIIEKRFNPSREFILGNYRDVAAKYGSGSSARENVRNSLEKIISEERKNDLASRPEQVLHGAEVLINDSMLENATTSVRKDEKGNDIYTIHLHMTDEGRKRLWKYSRNKKGSNLLVVVNGVAIAAPKITTELAGRQLDLTDLREKRLVDEAVNQITELKSTN